MKKLFRAALGAVWSLLLRVLTVPAMLGTMLLTAGGSLSYANLTDPKVILSGVLVGAALRFVDNLAIEFVVFPWAIKMTERWQQND